MYGLVTLGKSSEIYLWQTELQRAWTLESSSIRNCGGHPGHQMGKSWVRCWSVEAGSRVGHDVVGTEHLLGPWSQWRCDRPVSGLGRDVSIRLRI